MSAHQFADHEIHYIRTSGISDAEMARILKKTPESVRRVRIGIHYASHPTPPDKAPRESRRGGRIDYFASAEADRALLNAALRAWR